LSLSSRPENVRFAAFTAFYKNFKDYFFKVFVEPDGRKLFYNAAGSTKFPFYWTENSDNSVSVSYFRVYVAVVSMDPSLKKYMIRIAVVI